MIPAVLLTAAVVGLPLGYFLWRASVRAEAAETSCDEWIASHSALEAKYHDVTARLASQRRATDTANDAADRQRVMAHRHRERADDLERLLVAEQARTEIHESTHACLPGLAGIAEHGVSDPAGEVVDDEPLWVGLVREVADVVPIKRGAK